MRKGGLRVVRTSRGKAYCHQLVARNKLEIAQTIRINCVSNYRSSRRAANADCSHEDVYFPRDTSYVILYSLPFMCVTQRDAKPCRRHHEMIRSAIVTRFPLENLEIFFQFQVKDFHLWKMISRVRTATFSI